jgi:pyruvate formate lyase activating enzyme
MRLARRAGLVTAFKSNGYMTPEAIDVLTDTATGEVLLDAVNVDLKGFDDGYYRRVCGAQLQPVCDAIIHLHRHGIWVEVATLLIPGVNDGDDELDALAGFLADISPEIPWHVWRFHPDYRMRDRPWTHMNDIDRAVGIGRAAGLRYVYASNAPGDPSQHTRCPGCGALLIARDGYTVAEAHIRDGACLACGHRLPGIFAPGTLPVASIAQ